MKTIHLHGELGQHFGETHRLEVKSPAEAIRALCVTKRGFAAYLNQQEYRYRVLVGEDERGKDMLDVPTSRDTIHIVPVVEGGKSPWVQTLTGVALVAGSFFATGGIASFMLSAGVSWGLGGVTRLLAGDPKGVENAENTPSYFFSGPVNTTQQGHCVPVLYGEMEIGSALISVTEQTAVFTRIGTPQTGLYVANGAVVDVLVNGPSDTANIAEPLVAFGEAGTRVWTITNAADLPGWSIDGSNNLVATGVGVGFYWVRLHVEIQGSTQYFCDGEILFMVWDQNGERPQPAVGALDGIFGGGNTQSTPIENPNTLIQTSVVYTVDLLSEGPIEGFGSTDKAEIGKKIYLNDTPIRTSDGGENFAAVDFDYRLGEPDQTAMGGSWPLDPSTPTSVNVELKHATPYTLSVSSGKDAVVLTVGIPALYQIQDNGNQTGAKVEIRISVQPSGGSYMVWATDSFDGKCTSRYQRQYDIDLRRYGSGPYTIKVERLTADSGSSKLVNATWIDQYALKTVAKLKYPNSALVAVKADAKQFSSIPKRSFRVKGLLIQIPSNYNPTTRVYTGEWDGTFITAYSNNPAWVIYDMLTANRYGLGRWVDVDAIDKWSFYAIGQRCDEQVSDGLGGYEPRFTCNAYLQSADDAYRVLSNFASVFWGLSFWGSNALYLAADSPSDPVAIFHDNNVTEEGFTYSGLSDQDRPNALLIGWNDPADHYRQKWAYVPDEVAITDDGQIRQKDLVAFGCTSEGQAVRFGRYLLEASREAVNFETGFMGSVLRPGDIILIQDNARTRAMRGGRIISSDGSSHYLDAEVTLEAGRTYSLLSQLPDGSIMSKPVLTPSGTDGYISYAVATEPFPTPLGWMHAWLLQDTTGDPAEYRVTRVREVEPERYAVEAMRWDRTKFDRIDTIILEPRPTGGGTGSNLDGSVKGVTGTTRIVIGGDIPQVWADLSWTAYSSANSYEVEHQADGQDSWTKTTTQTNQVSIQIPNPGLIESRARFKVRAIVGTKKSPDALFDLRYTGVNAADWITLSEKPSLIQQALNISNDRTNLQAVVDGAMLSTPVPSSLTAADTAWDNAYTAWSNYITDVAKYEVDGTEYPIEGWDDTNETEPIYMGPGGRSHWKSLQDAYWDASITVNYEATNWLRLNATDWIVYGEKPALIKQKAAVTQDRSDMAGPLARAKAKGTPPSSLGTAETAWDDAYDDLIAYLDDSEQYGGNSIAGWDNTSLTAPIWMGNGGRAHWDGLFFEYWTKRNTLSNEIFDWLTT